jgi:hypothetical protein
MWISLTHRTLPLGYNSSNIDRHFFFLLKNPIRASRMKPCVGRALTMQCIVAHTDERKAAADESLAAYKAASDIALTELPPTHPIRLGLALNFSVFYYEIMNSPDRACHLAKQVGVVCRPLVLVYSRPALDDQLS